ncbi:amino acid carrier protein [Salinisphaera sp. P385]|uniref:Amino acid carrier protein n=1 Tax=Spectribacter acetivorans TaxID=3075603 RepID=A0ABU3BCS0_9GAMM|nr:amino acid carrier protein [Salinisphaera sp. P385]MDT0619048.1 amino acid carrier protein [Salinisphaera sp. P385]
MTATVVRAPGILYAGFMRDLFDWLLALVNGVNAAVFSAPVLIALLAVGALFTLWTRAGQLKALTHGVALITGRYDTGKGSGAISHFQAVSAALSATVGLGNIAGVALALEFGGPGAIFWMWVVGLAGMAIKMVEVTLTMLYRNTDDPDNPHGGAMWVARRGLPTLSARLTRPGAWIGGLFCVALITNALAANAVFQSWSVADTTRSYFGVPPLVTGGILAVVVGLVTLGGVKRIGAVAGWLVPGMAVLYVTAGLVVLALQADTLPGVLASIFRGAFSHTEGTGAFLGGGMAMAFIWGLKRALFSSEAGLGTAPIAHAAVKTSEPVSEGIVAGLEPLVDTLVVCTITALVILSTGIWQRDASLQLDPAPGWESTGSGAWTLADSAAPMDDQQTLNTGDRVFVIVNADAGERQRVFGEVRANDDRPVIDWQSVTADSSPELVDAGLYRDYTGATLTARAFDTAVPGLGQWLITLAIWLFAVSTMITWSYYGEQGVVYLAGDNWVAPYRLGFCAMVWLACAGWVDGARELDAVGVFGVALMLCINLPLTLLLAPRAIAAYRDYLARLRAGALR